METRFTEVSKTDLDFLVEAVSPEVKDKIRLKEIILQDADFRRVVSLPFRILSLSSLCSL